MCRCPAQIDSFNSPPRKCRPNEIVFHGFWALVVARNAASSFIQGSSSGCASAAVDARWAAAIMMPFASDAESIVTVEGMPAVAYIWYLYSGRAVEVRGVSRLTVQFFFSDTSFPKHLVAMEMSYAGRSALIAFLVSSPSLAGRMPAILFLPAGTDKNRQPAKLERSTASLKSYRRNSSNSQLANCALRPTPCAPIFQTSAARGE
jgi:hypothetical protein